MKTIIYSIILVLTISFAQAQEKTLIQFSGLILSSDSLQSIPYATVLIKDFNRGTVSDYRGFFSVVASPGDDVKFTHVGYKTVIYTIPDTLQAGKYSIIQLMTTDTIHLTETVVYPWPTPEQFRQAFLALDIPDDDLERAKKNLDRQRMRELGLAMKMDAGENTDYYLRQEAHKFQYAGQIPPSNIFNPFAWAKFISDWKKGVFKKKRKKY